MSSVQHNDFLTTTYQQKSIDFACNLLLIAVWAWLFKRLLGYLAVIIFRSDFRFNQLLLIMIIVLTVWHIRQSRLRLKLTAVPAIHAQSLMMMLGGVAAYLLCETYLGINTVSASFMILGSYGLIGLWMSHHAWRKSLPVAFLVVCVLPLGPMLQTFIGYPMRIITAEMVHTMLVQMGIPTVTTSTILVTVNGISNIDLPCSGVQSIWTGTMFLMVATWLEKRRLDMKWVGIWLALMALLFVANLSRVFALTMLGPVWNWWEIAEILHVPLGVCGFVFACGASLILLRQHTLMGDRDDNRLTKPNRFVAPSLIGLIAFLAIIHTPYNPLLLESTRSPIEWEFPDTLKIVADPLEKNQYDLLMRDGADSADRYRFSWGEQTGSIILVASHTWRAHHVPARCFEVAGHKPLTSEPLMVDDLFSIRTLTMMDSDQTAAYWFQSSNHTTDDYTQRIWADLKKPRDNWVLVSILFDTEVDHQAADIEAFYKQLHNMVTDQLTTTNLGDV